MALGSSQTVRRRVREHAEPAGPVKLTSEYVFCWYLNRKSVSAEGIQSNSREPEASFESQGTYRSSFDEKFEVGHSNCSAALIFKRLRSFNAVTVRKFLGKGSENHSLSMFDFSAVNRTICEWNKGKTTFTGCKRNAVARGYSMGQREAINNRILEVFELISPI